MSTKGFSPTTERSLNDYRYDIAEYIKTNGPYSHNLISLTLEIVEKSFGNLACLQIIKEFNLDSVKMPTPAAKSNSKQVT